MFHISSPYFLHLFLPFFSQFSKCQTLKLFPSQVDGCLQARGEGQDFLLQWILPVQKYMNRLHGFCVDDPRLRLCGTQTHLFSVATKVYDAEWFFCSYPRKKCHGNPKGTPLVRRFLLGQLETDGWPDLRTLRELILHPPWSQTYSLRMFSIGS